MTSQVRTYSDKNLALFYFPWLAASKQISSILTFWRITQDVCLLAICESSTSCCSSNFVSGDFLKTSLLTMLLREALRFSVSRVVVNDVSRRYCVIQLPDTTLDSDDGSSSASTSASKKWKLSSPSKLRLRGSLKKANTREVEQFGSWDLRLNFPLLEEQSIKRGTPIPLLTMDKVGHCTHQGRREYQVRNQIKFHQ